MKVSLLTFFIFTSSLLAVESIPDEAQRAFEYLNHVRANPSLFSKEVNVDLSHAAKRPALLWDNRLAASAQEKAEDLANRDYLDHFSPEGIGPGELLHKHGYYLPLSWPDSSEFNYVESISAGSSRSGVNHIINLLYDHGVPDSSPKANHRKHLLGMNKFWASHVHIGIGFAYNPKAKFKGYLVVHTGVPGVPFVTVTGSLNTPNPIVSTAQTSEIWYNRNSIDFYIIFFITSGCAFSILF